MSKLNFISYTCYRCGRMFYLKGRLLKGKLWHSAERDGYLRSIIKTILRLLSRELKMHPIKLTYDNQVYSITSDHEGYFELITELEERQDYSSTAKLSTVYKQISFEQEVPLVVYNDHVGQGVISDIDDTILVTGVRSLFKTQLLLNSIFINPFRRKAIASAADFLNQQKRVHGQESPIMYISNSPWNMFFYLRSFLLQNKFPDGELILRDFGLHLMRKKKSLESRNKYQEILKILKTFPKTQFTLVGDSAEQDFDIYTHIYKKFPDQVSRLIILMAGNKLNEQYIQQAMDQLDIECTLVENFDQLLPSKL